MEEDVLGLTFQEWTPDVDTSRTPVSILINSNVLRDTGLKLKVLEVFPPTLETDTSSGSRTWRGTVKF